MLKDDKRGDKKIKSGPRDRFLSTFTLISRIGIKTSFTFDSSRMDFWLPLVGLFVSLLCALTFTVSLFVFSDPLLAAIAVLAVQYFTFNLFHLDGLADTADAFLAPLDGEQRKKILKDPRIGSYALFTVILVLIAKLALLIQLGELAFAWKGGAILWWILGPLAAYPISGRAGAALIPALFPPAGLTGLGPLAKDSKLHRCLMGFGMAMVLWAFISILPLVVLGLELTGMVILAVFWLLPSLSAFFAALTIGRLYRRDLGGYTGDALGAAVELGELGHILILFLILKIGSVLVIF